MIDFIKSLNLVLLDNIESNQKFNWITKVSENGVIISEKTTFKRLFIEKKNNKYSLSGSLHYFFNNGIHNYNDFDFEAVKGVVLSLSKSLAVDVVKTNMNNVEFGVNVVLPFDPDLLLQNLVSYRGERFYREIEENKTYYQCKLKQYYLKIYNKGKQNLLNENILRFEIKVVKMQYLETKKIKLNNWNDLLNQANYPPLGNLLNHAFKEIIFSDKSLDFGNMTATDREVYFKGSNATTWEKKGKRNDKEQKEIERFKSKYFEVIRNHKNGIDFRKITAERIKSKIVELSEIYRPDLSILNDREKVEKMPIVGNLHFKYKVKKRHNTINQIGIDDTPKINLPNMGSYCRTCGRDISKQKKGSLYCSEKLFGKDVKRCRNVVSNPMHNQLNDWRRIRKN